MKKRMFLCVFSILGMTAFAQDATVLSADNYVLEVEVNHEYFIVERTNTNVAVVPGEMVFIQIPTGTNEGRVINQNIKEVGVLKTFGFITTDKDKLDTPL